MFYSSRLSDFSLSPSFLGMGTWHLDLKNWQGSSLKRSILALEKAWEWGVNFIDTSPFYGLGSCELALSSFLSSRRNSIFLSNKYGLETYYSSVRINLSPQFLEKEFLISLKRLKVEYIDLYQLHYLSQSVEETWLAIEWAKKYQKKGLIRYIGLANLSEQDLITFAPYIDSIQIHYSILFPELKNTLLRLAHEKGLCTIVYGVLEQSVLLETQALNESEEQFWKRLEKQQAKIRKHHYLWKYPQFRKRLIDQIRSWSSLSMKERIKLILSDLCHAPIDIFLLGTQRLKHLYEVLQYVDEIRNN